MTYYGEQKREYDRQWIHKRRQDWIDDNGPCVKCGSYDRLEVDHKNPEEKITHRLWTRNKDFRDLELAKCQVLCYDCHLEKTISEKTKTHCIKGHEYTEENTYRYPNGARQCRICKTEGHRQEALKRKIKRREAKNGS